MKPGDFEVIVLGTAYKLPSFAVVKGQGLEHRPLGDIVIHFVRGSKSADENVEEHHGVTHESLLEMMIHDLKQKNKLVPCRETSLVITNLEQALGWQKRRQELRSREGTQGTYKTGSTEADRQTVFSDDDCIFNYCPHPDNCREDGCPNKRNEES